MDEQLDQYKVFWETSIGIGATFYEGIERVYAESEEQAAQDARVSVWRRGFRDWPITHIVVLYVERA